MATDPRRSSEPEEPEIIRTPVPGGTGHVESLGKFIDNLMGHAKIERKVDAQIAEHIKALNAQAQENPNDSPRPLPDPKPEKPPPAVPDGTGIEEKGGKPGETRPLKPDQTKTGSRGTGLD